MIESGFDPLDRSHAGAVGLWQFMPEGGRIYGLREDYWIDERRNPEKATEAFVRYMGDLKERFGAWPLTLAAFNAGYGAVLRAMQKYNTNDYWELCRHEDGLPWETTLYVPKAMAVAIVGENKKLFGYDEVAPDPPYAFDRVAVPASTSVAAMARAAGVSVAEIGALNPELRRNRTPPEPWQARVPRGAGARFAAAWPAASRNGQTNRRPLRRAAGRPRARPTARRCASCARSTASRTAPRSRPGLTLVVPDGRRPLSPPPCETTIVAVPDKDEVVAGRKRVFYRTLPQDSPSEIAAFFKVKPAELARWNHLDLDAKLAGNMVLQLWVANDFDAAQAALVDPSRVRVVTVGSRRVLRSRRGTARAQAADLRRQEGRRSRSASARSSTSRSPISSASIASAPRTPSSPSARGSRLRPDDGAGEGQGRVCADAGRARARQQGQGARGRRRGRRGHRRGQDRGAAVRGAAAREVVVCGAVARRAVARGAVARGAVARASGRA